MVQKMPSKKSELFQKHLKIFLASDHAGFEMKNFLAAELKNIGLEVVDLGCDSSTNSVDYPDYAQKLCREIPDLTSQDGKITKFGILVCGSGVGISIAANRFSHIRAALCFNSKMAKLARAHNDANVLCLGARFVKPKTALAMVKNFLITDFEGQRHVGRVNKLR